MTESLFIMCVFGIILIIIEYSRYLERDKWQKERNDLHDRIMSKSLPEYKEHTQPTPVYDAISKSDEDLYELEIEENKVNR